MKKSAKALGLNNRARGMHGGAVVVARVEEGVVVAALELEARFEDFGRDVYGGSGEIGDEAWDFSTSLDTGSLLTYLL
jgi:hypothetical protein